MTSNCSQDDETCMPRKWEKQPATSQWLNKRQSHFHIKVNTLRYICSSFLSIRRVLYNSMRDVLLLYRRLFLKSCVSEKMHPKDLEETDQSHQWGLTGPQDCFSTGHMSCTKRLLRGHPWWSVVKSPPCNVGCKQSLVRELRSHDTEQLSLCHH